MSKENTYTMKEARIRMKKFIRDSADELVLEMKEIKEEERYV